MGYYPIGESQFQRRTTAVPPLAAVANATRAQDYMQVYRAPVDQGALVKSVKFDPNATLAAAATDFVTLQMVRIFGTTVTAVGSSITTNTGGGWTALVEQDLVKESHGVRLRPNERLALRIANTGLGKATTGFSLHKEIEIGK